MYHRRRRSRSNSRQRSSTPAFSFCEDASTVTTSDVSPECDAVEDLKDVSSQMSSEKFLFTNIDSADEYSSECKSIKTDAISSLPFNCITRDVSLYKCFENSLSSSWVKPGETMGQHSHCIVSRDTNLLSKGAEGINSFAKGKLLDSLTDNTLLMNGENSSNDNVAKWEILEDITCNFETPRKNRLRRVSSSKTYSEKSYDSDDLFETTQISCSLPRKRLSHHQSNDNLQESRVTNRKRSRTSLSRKYSGGTTKYEADESGVLKKRFEVEKIIDHCTSKNKRYYYVKWKGWDSCYNTWEPEEHLKTCKEVMKDYIQFLRQRVSSGNLFASQAAKDMQEELVVISRTELERIMKLHVKSNGVPYTVCSEEEIIHKMKTVLRSMKIQKAVKSVEKVKNDILHRAYDIYRWVQIDALKTWENELNTKATEKAKILVENNVDLEGPPLNFTYVNDYIPGKDVIIPDEPPIGCTCGSKCDRRHKECCGTQSGSIFAYSSKRLLVASVGVPIYECNKRCRCDANCFNRVVQRGRKIDLSIFRTSSGCGWGVKTLQHIKSGAFICEYVGEVITTKEAERRGKIYDAEGRTYLFDLDFNVDACPYTVDAAVYGNISHFINHSCNPNVAVFAVWINCLDPNLPKLALFAKKAIKAGEELTFDYMHNNSSIQNDMNVANQMPSPRSRLVLPDVQDSSELRSSKTRCKCGAQQCKRYLF